MIPRFLKMILSEVRSFSPNEIERIRKEIEAVEKQIEEHLKELQAVKKAIDK